MKEFLLIIYSVLLLANCKGTDNESIPSTSMVYYNMDSLLNGQINWLAQSEAELIKTYNNGEFSQEILLMVDSSQWVELLSAFHVIDINKPSLRDAYHVVDNLSDSNSNLTILQYQLKENIGNQLLKEVNFYYLESIENLKKIVAKTASSGFIYNSNNTFHLIFDQSKNHTYLKAYSITTSQKTLFRDSVNLHIDFEVKY